MAKIAELDVEAFEKWVASRPLVIQEMIRACPPDRLYSMKCTGHRCTIYSYNEDGSVTVDVTGEYNRITFACRVFGVALDDLTECELPAEGEPLGAILTDPVDIDAFLKNIGSPRDISSIPTPDTNHETAFPPPSNPGHDPS